MFGKSYNISLNRVHDRVRISEGSERLELTVEADPMRLVAGLNKAQAMLKAINPDSDDAAMTDAAMCFAGTIFGDDQARKILDFYRGDAGCVVNVCGRYFSDRLSGLIERAQRRAK